VIGDHFPSVRVWGCFLIALAAWGLLPSRAAAISESLAAELARWEEDSDEGERFEFPPMDRKPWSRVFDWLSDQTGLPVITTFTPKGSLTFRGPKGARYSIPQILRVINRSLIGQGDGCLLVRGKRAFCVWPAEDYFLAFAKSFPVHPVR
jgi:hypothetical protein